MKMLIDGILTLIAGLMILGAMVFIWSKVIESVLPYKFFKLWIVKAFIIGSAFFIITRLVYTERLRNEPYLRQYIKEQNEAREKFRPTSFEGKVLSIKRVSMRDRINRDVFIQAYYADSFGPLNNYFSKSDSLIRLRLAADYLVEVYEGYRAVKKAGTDSIDFYDWKENRVISVPMCR